MTDAGDIPRLAYDDLERARDIVADIDDRDLPDDVDEAVADFVDYVDSLHDRVEEERESCDCEVCSDPNRGVCSSGFSDFVTAINGGGGE